jgi:hypothetical protein
VTVSLYSICLLRIVYTGLPDRLAGRTTTLCHNRLYPSVRDLELGLEERRDGIFKLLRSPGIYSKESIPSAYVAWRTGITTRFLAPGDYSKIPALEAGRWPVRYITEYI